MRVRIQMLLVLVVLAAFGPGLVGTFVWDDHTLIVQNARLRDPSQLGALLRTDFWDISALGETGTTLRGLYWRPVVTLAYFVQYQFFGAQPMGYHAVSLALHLACALLTFGWLHRRLGSATTDDTRRNLAAAAGAMVFAVHPTRPETVTWIAGCTDLWMTFWMLLAAWRFDDDTRDRHGLLAALCTSLAVLSKEAALLTPLLFALDVWALDAPPPRRRKLVAVAVAAGATLLLRMVLVPPPSTAGATTGAAETLRRVVVTLGLYVRTTVWPSPPTVQLGYRVWDASGRAVYPAAWLALGVVALAAVALVGVRALRRARWRPWAADLAWFIAPLALVLNVVNLYVDTLGSMRLLYLPLLGASALLARGLASVGDARTWRIASGVVAASALAMLLVTVGHVGHFITEEDLWTHELAVEPRNPYACGELARVRQLEGRLDRAAALLAQGISGARALGHRHHEHDLVIRLASTLMLATPDHAQRELVIARDFFDAVDRGDAGPIPLDLRGYHAALRWNASERALRRSALNYRMVRAITWARTLAFDEAERQLTDIVRATPGAWLAWQNLALVYASADRWEAAVRALQEGLRHNPANAQGMALLDTSRRMQTELARTPAGSEAHVLALASALGQLHAWEAARRHLDRYLATAPSPAVLRARVQLERDLGRDDAAAEVLRAAQARGVPGG